MLHSRRAACVLGCLLPILAGASGLRAEPPAPKPDSEGVAARLGTLRERLAAYGEAPTDDDPLDTLHEAWRVHLKPRSRKLVQRGRELARESLWLWDERKERILRLDGEKWGAWVRRAASLYTELGATAEAYAGTKVDSSPLQRGWLRDHPEPDLEGPTSVSGEIARLRGLIAWHRARGEVVPSWIFAEIERLLSLDAQERERRAALHEQWRAERVRAFQDIERRMAAVRTSLLRQEDRIADDMAAVRALTGHLQALEESWLLSEVAGFPAEDPLHEEAVKLLVEMRKGREAGIAFRDARTSRYGSVLRQDWMVPRTKLLTALKAARKRASQTADD